MGLGAVPSHGRDRALLRDFNDRDGPLGYRDLGWWLSHKFFEIKKMYV